MPANNYSQDWTRAQQLAAVFNAERELEAVERNRAVIQERLRELREEEHRSYTDQELIRN